MIDQAKGILMMAHPISADAAFEIVRWRARSSTSNSCG
ncbi:ANTAR domain-containing protein [Mycolicibacterium hodleri]|uniref:ANTAR domain-containing protein n=1 Tax=Mycolicibacterium hodleri TaxID=49897 RepID=A0A502E7M2_9MYCO|nr:ANTAR domain-containing protein [Mycolicibacterium hodleri]